MAAGTYVIGGSATISASAPGVQASVTITATGAGATNWAFITPSSDVGRDEYIKYGLYVSSIDTNTLVVKASGKELPADVTFDYILFTSA